MRGLTVGDSPVDRFRLGERAALTPDEEAGLWIYEGKGGCWKCHNGPNFSDEDFHNTGVGAVDGRPLAAASRSPGTRPTAAASVRPACAC